MVDELERPDVAGMPVKLSSGSVKGQDRCRKTTQDGDRRQLQATSQPGTDAPRGLLAEAGLGVGRGGSRWTCIGEVRSRCQYRRLFLKNLRILGSRTVYRKSMKKLMST